MAAAPRARVAAVVFGALAVQDVVAGSDAHTPDPQLVAWIVAAYSVAAHADRVGALVGGALALGSTSGWIGLDDALLPVAVVGGAWVAGPWCAAATFARSRSRSGPSRWIASATSGPRRRWPRSERGSRASCTT